MAGAQPTAAVAGGSAVGCDSVGTGDDSDGGAVGCSVACWDGAWPVSLGCDGAGAVGPVGPVGSAVAVRSGAWVGDVVGAGVLGARLGTGELDEGTGAEGRGVADGRAVAVAGGWSLGAGSPDGTIVTSPVRYCWARLSTTRT
jgi:hypothetical protein